MQLRALTYHEAIFRWVPSPFQEICLLKKNGRRDWALTCFFFFLLTEARVIGGWKRKGWQFYVCVCLFVACIFFHCSVCKKKMKFWVHIHGPFSGKWKVKSAVWLKRVLPGKRVTHSPSSSTILYDHYSNQRPVSCSTDNLPPPPLSLTLISANDENTTLTTTPRIMHATAAWLEKC